MSSVETTASKALFERGLKCIAGGNTRNSVYFPPHPYYAARGEGSRIIDVDGNSRLDFVNCNSAAILGHGNQQVLDALASQAKQMISSGMPTDGEIRLAEIIVDRLSSADCLRFVNSGTEAVMFSVRAARAFTGRNKIARIEGAYHGSYDPFYVSLNPTPENWGPVERPTSVPCTSGLSEFSPQEVLTLTFNDVEQSRKLIEQHGNELSCVVIDPMVSKMGFLKATPEYLDMIRTVTKELGIVLIFDEVLSFRLGHSGAQGKFGIAPDLTALGKVIGGGLPVGAIAGSREVMSVFDQTKGRPKVDQSGTFSGNPMTMAAGVATMEQLTPDQFAHLDALGKQAREGIREIIGRRKISAQVNGDGSLFSLLFHDRPYRNYREFVEAAISTGAVEKGFALHRYLLDEGIFHIAPGAFIISTAMTSSEIDFLLEKLDQGISAVI